MTRSAPPKAVDVAIVTWNTSAAAIDAARAYAESSGAAASVTVVDNGSAAAQRRILEEGAPDGVRLELVAENLGYGAAANRALAGGTGELVCVSNADVLADPAALAALAAAAADPANGMVGPAFDGDGDRYHAELPTGPALLGQAFAGSFMRRPVASPAPGEVREVGQPSGACFVMRRETWERFGGFDEGFFLWFEDVDLAKRLHDAGLRNLVVGDARVGHTTAGSFQQLDSRTMHSIRLPSLRRYIDKHHPRLGPLAAPLLWTSARIRGGGPPRPGSETAESGR